MKILFAVAHAGFLRNFESGLRHLVARGHTVHVAFGRQADAESVTGTGLHVLQRIREGALTTSVTGALANEWSALGTDFRTARDYWRYLRPEYDDAAALRDRARTSAPAFATARIFDRAVARRPVDGALRFAERRLPLPQKAFEILDEHRPDVVVLTPLLYFQSDQVYLLRAARARGIPTVYAAGSWDHLTTKGLVHDTPDLALLWNQQQVDECRQFHGIPPSRCAITGAQAYDHWFAQKPQITREAFCAGAGVPADRPLLLYVCSSRFIGGDERQIVRDWTAALRAADSPVRDAAVIVRPHPQNTEQWRDESFADGLTVVWPRSGVNPVTSEARADFFHSMYFSSAVVGLNTSAQVEAAILGRPVLSVLTPRYAATQRGTLHFRHLEGAGGGLLYTASSFGEHVAQLDALLRQPGGQDERARTFTEAFVRPRGRDREAGEIFAGAVERAEVHPARVPRAGRMMQSLLRPLADASQAASNIRATKASPRFQSWFLPSQPAGSVADPRVLCVALTPEAVEEAVSLSTRIGAEGGRTLLCVPDSSAASAAAKTAASRLRRCVTVGLPDGAERATLLLRKFQPTAAVFLEQESRVVAGAMYDAALRLKIPVAATL